MSDKMEFRGKALLQTKMFTNHWFLKISLEDISILTLDIPKNITAKYTKQILTELACETDKSAITMGDVSTCLNN